MKLYLLAPIFLLLACSSPRYLYRFHEPPGSTLAKQPPVRKAVDEVPEPPGSDQAPAIYSANVATPAPAPAMKRVEALDGTHAIRKADHAAKKSPPAEEHLDGDLKRAVIFVVAGGVALLIGGQVFYVAGSLSLLIGLIFGIKWFIRL